MRESTLNQRQKLAIFLLTIALFIPWNTVCFYYEYYGELDLLARKHFSDDEENVVLNLFEKRISDFIEIEQTVQVYEMSFLYSAIQIVDTFISTPFMHFILRC